MKNSIILIIIIFLAILVLAGYSWYKNQQRVPAPEILDSLTEDTLPGIKPLSNPLEKNPDLNPIAKTNPFKGLYKNPFE